MLLWVHSQHSPSCSHKKVQKQSATDNIMEISFHVAFFVPANTTTYKTLDSITKGTVHPKYLFTHVVPKSMIFFVCGVKRQKKKKKKKNKNVGNQEVLVLTDFHVFLPLFFKISSFMFHRTGLKRHECE